LFGVTNTGARPGSEVVQLYVGFPEGFPVEQPLRSLKAFAKVELAPGASKRVELVLGPRAFAYWSTAANDWRVEPGCYAIMVGRSSRDIHWQGVFAQGGATCTD
jgi:beta-glucosidase